MVRIPHYRAMRLAERIQAELAPGCTRIEIAGSIRRERPDVKDVELVAMPRIQMGGLLGDIPTDLLNLVITQLVDAGRLGWRDQQGVPCAPPKSLDDRKYYRLRAIQADVPIDLFVVRPPAQWGAIMAIRTGPADYSQALVTRARFRGMRCEEGHLVMIGTGQILDTPEEDDFIRACGFTPVLPRDRRA